MNSRNGGVDSHIWIPVLYFAGVFSGLTGAVLVAVTSAVADAVVHRKTARKAAFNIGTMVVSAGAFCGVLEAFSSTYGDGDYVAMIGPSMVAALAGFATNSGLVTLAISLDQGYNPLTVWNEAFRGMLPHYIFVGVLAALIALAYDRWKLGGLALFLLPLAMAWLLMKQYTDYARKRADRKRQLHSGRGPRETGALVLSATGGLQRQSGAANMGTCRRSR